MKQGQKFKSPLIIGEEIFPSNASNKLIKSLNNIYNDKEKDDEATRNLRDFTEHRVNACQKIAIIKAIYSGKSHYKQRAVM